MMNNQKQIKKICNFYVDNWHWTMTILPNINKMIEENELIVTMLEEDTKENIEKIINKMNIKQETKTKILEVDWKGYPICKYNEVKVKIEEKIKENKNINIIIKGTDEYINKMNEAIEKLVNNVKLNNEIKIINCYEVKNNKEIQNILLKHELILNTSGIKAK